MTQVQRFTKRRRCEKFPQRFFKLFPLDQQKMLIASMLNPIALISANCSIDREGETYPPRERTTGKKKTDFPPHVPTPPTSCLWPQRHIGLPGLFWLVWTVFTNKPISRAHFCFKLVFSFTFLCV